jgi:hypothetical protein
MNVTKKDMVVIPPNIKEYYKLKQYYQEKKKCKNCKSPKIVFLEEHRILSCVCPTSKCKSNMRILIDSYVTYDEKYNESKQHYNDSVNTVLREKFNIIFKYKDASDITEIATQYTRAKENFNEIQQKQIEKIEQHHALLVPELEQRSQMIDAIKKGSGIETLQTDLNVVLNKIHALTYVTMGETTLPTPEFDLEIFTLN